MDVITAAAERFDARPAYRASTAALIELGLTTSQPVAMVRACRCIDQNGSRPLTVQGSNQAAVCTRKGVAPTQYHYIIVRADLPPGLQVAQTVHAAGESASPRPKPGTHAVALHAKNEAHLQRIAQRLFDAGIEHHCVLECDDDPDYPGQMMSIGLYPRTGKCKELSDLPLVK